jgi:hypothetical protein
LIRDLQVIRDSIRCLVRLRGTADGPQCIQQRPEVSNKLGAFLLSFGHVASLRFLANAWLQTRRFRSLALPTARSKVVLDSILLEMEIDTPDKTSNDSLRHLGIRN